MDYNESVQSRRCFRYLSRDCRQYFNHSGGYTETIEEASQYLLDAYISCSGILNAVKQRVRATVGSKLTDWKMAGRMITLHPKLIVTGNDSNLIKELMQWFLVLVEQSYHNHILFANPEKTAVVPFADRRKVDLKGLTQFGFKPKLSRLMIYLERVIDSSRKSWGRLRQLIELIKRPSNVA